MRTHSNAGTALAVRGQLAAHHAGQRLAGVIERRAHDLRSGDERGAQTLEYGMVGGVAAAACGCIALILKENPDLLRNVLDTILSTVGGAFRGWF